MIYSNLLELWGSSSDEIVKKVTPLENFTTEIFVWTLNNNRKVMISFIHDLLQIKGENFTIKSQCSYSYMDFTIRPDIIIENDKIICFIENKIESKENSKQLSNYMAYLKNQKKDSYLFYLTKNKDEKKIKEIKNHYFSQLRWFTIQTFLRPNITKDPFVNEFINFLLHQEIIAEKFLLEPKLSDSYQ